MGNAQKCKSDKTGNSRQIKSNADPVKEIALPPKKKSLSTFEKKELLTIGDKIEAAEAEVFKLRMALEDPQLASDHVKLQEVMNELQQAENEVNKLYARWEDLESRQEKF